MQNKYPINLDKAQSFFTAHSKRESECEGWDETGTSFPPCWRVASGTCNICSAGGAWAHIHPETSEV